MPQYAQEMIRGGRHWSRRESLSARSRPPVQAAGRGCSPTITKVLWPGSGQEEVPPDVADVVILPYSHGDTRHLAAAR
jgi:hypothetical protein